MTILTYAFIFSVGVILGALFKDIVIPRKYGGVIQVIHNLEENKTVYSLELEEDPEMLMFKKEIRFKIVPPEKSPNRV